MTWVSAIGLDSAEELGMAEAVERVEASLRLGIDPSLEPIRKILDELGHPEYAYECVQVAGTNGKTSTSRYTAALLRACGYKVGLYTSPHLVSYTERIEIDGRPVDEACFAHGVSLALKAWEGVCACDPAMAAQGVTEFELLTAAAFTIYALNGVDFAVLEVGLGGRWDATSAAPTAACAVTGIGLDHMAILGDTLGKIAVEKAQVIRPGNPVVLGTGAVRPPEVLDVMLGRCEQVDVRPCVVVDAANANVAGLDEGECDRAVFHITHAPTSPADVLAFDVSLRVDLPDEGYIDAVYPGIRLSGPVYQAQNAACALALATAVAGEPIDPALAALALGSCPVPGRFQTLSRDPLVMVDACHNPQSAEAFRDAVEAAFPRREERPVLVLGALADKDYRGIVKVVVPLFDRVVVTQSASGRALAASEVAAEVELVSGRKPLGVYPDVRQTVRALYGESFIACGTITLIGEIAELFE